MSYNTPTYDTGPVFIYGLVDPRTGSIFYVGISIAPESTLARHRNDPASSAYWRCREIIAAGLELDVIEQHPTRRAAELRERSFIAVLPHLVNRERRQPVV